MGERIDTIIVGPGPYGLSISAHLTARGVDHRIFGSPMQFWLDMPVGIFLKSLDFATSVYTPRRGYTFIDYCKSFGLSSDEPVPMSVFAGYGLWAQQELVPHLERVDVTRISRLEDGFGVELADGRYVESRRVVVATGLSHLAHMPEPLRGMPRELVSHTFQHRDYKGFPGREVAVLGRGSSALEAAALLYESGSKPTLITRRSAEWLFAFPPKLPRPLHHHILYPMSALGPGRANFVLDRVPFGLHYLPDRKRVAFTRKHLGPWGPWWLAGRFEGKVPVLSFSTVQAVAPRGGRLAITIQKVMSGETRELVVDHLIAGTGYLSEIGVLPFLDPALAARIERVEGAPRLASSFECSVPGLYFVGASSSFSFGPLMRFVAGAKYTSATVAAHIAGAARRYRFGPLRSVVDSIAPFLG